MECTVTSVHRYLGDDLQALCSRVRSLEREAAADSVQRTSVDQADRIFAAWWKCLEDDMRRWQSIRDQYRRERQQRARSGYTVSAKNRKYIYYDRLYFLDPSMDLRPTQSNLTERETGSDSVAIIDPVGEGGKVAGPSSHPSSVIPPATSSVATQDPATTGEETAAPPTAAPHPGSQKEAGNSSSPTVPLETSPQPAVIYRHGRRRRELQESRRIVDTGVLNYLAGAAQDDGEEAFTRSLTRYLRPIPHEARLHVRGCIQILIDSCTPTK
ncbi:uncharacterized protein [Ranitomeya imitator]|uniref:uncharacterized protein n=1 Tax=Ranitomeya imitator TaxID=111125 RepID=UPI0037E711FE